MNAKTWAPIATFVAVAAVGVTAALVYDGGGGGGGPRALKLASGSGTDAARSAAGGTSGGYQLDVTLSADKPADQRAYGLTGGPADSDLVARLAQALKAGTPVRDGDGWRAGGLAVSGKDGQSWSWSQCGAGPDVAVSSDGSTSSTGCAIAVEGTVTPASPVAAPGAVSGSSGSGSSGSSGSGTAVAPPPSTTSPQPEPDPISDAVVKDGARAVLAAVGLDIADATIDTSPYGGSATVERPGTVGMTTRVDVDRAGRVQSAAGWLGTAQPGDRYPVISAKDAYDELPALAYPDICRIGPDGKGCLPPEPTIITGAELGLSLQPTTDGGAVLVPSWLFALKTGGRIAAIAIEKQYRTAGPEDTPGTVEPGTNPGSVDPAPPTEVAPPAPAQTLVAVMSAKRGPKPDSVVVTYDNGGCGHKNLQAQAKEDDAHVYVVLTADPVAGDMVCTQELRPTDVTIDLQAALADRQVIDTSTDKPVPLTP